MADSEPESVRVSQSPDGITTITIDRRHRKNAVDPLAARKLVTALAAFEQDAAQKVCVFHGANGTFCAGLDLHDLAGSGRGPGDYGEYAADADAHRLGHNPAPMGPSRMLPSKPVICAVSGYAVAGGLELALIADLRVAEEDAVFGVFNRRFGVPLVDGGTVRLPAIVGLGRALDMILTGRPVSAREALQFGLVNRVVPTGTALDEAMRIARQLLAFPQACIKADRASCYYSAFAASSFEDALKNEYDKGIGVVAVEGLSGASRFSAGAGRHGVFPASGL